jgi:beta-carotene 3-hydroxylase
MSILLGTTLFLITVVGMELFAYVMHRWVMHGPGWFLHADHHSPRKGFWELNDLYFVIFALPSATLIILGTSGTTGHWATIIGAGVAAYGAIYVGFHDIIVHKRLNHRYIPKSAYMKRIIQAHRLHHVVETREGTVSYGFLWAPKPEELKAELARRGRTGVRAPSGLEADRVS